MLACGGDRICKELVPPGMRQDHLEGKVSQVEQLESGGAGPGLRGQFPEQQDPWQ